MKTANYLGRKINVRIVKNRHGGKDVQVKVNGQFFCTDANSTEDKSIETTKRYIDMAIERPGAFPVLD
jgi:hypothetical protein